MLKLEKHENEMLDDIRKTRELIEELKKYQIAIYHPNVAGHYDEERMADMHTAAQKVIDDKEDSIWMELDSWMASQPKYL